MLGDIVLSLERTNIYSGINKLRIDRSWTDTPTDSEKFDTTALRHNNDHEWQYSEMIKLFLSYSHQDEDLRKELEKHLAALRRDDVIDIWQDYKED